MKVRAPELSAAPPVLPLAALARTADALPLDHDVAEDPGRIDAEGLPHGHHAPSSGASEDSAQQ